VSILTLFKKMFRRNGGSALRIYQDKRDPRITRVEIADAAGSTIADTYAALRRHIDKDKKMAAMERALETASIRIHEEHLAWGLADDDRESLLSIVEAFLYVHDDGSHPLLEPIIDSEDLTDQESTLFDAVTVYFDFQDNLKDEVELYLHFKNVYLEKLKTL
jgi:hypothetical protein